MVEGYCTPLTMLVYCIARPAVRAGRGPPRPQRLNCWNLVRIARSLRDYMVGGWPEKQERKVFRLELLLWWRNIYTAPSFNDPILVQDMGLRAGPPCEQWPRGRRHTDWRDPVLPCGIWDNGAHCSSPPMRYWTLCKDHRDAFLPRDAQLLFEPSYPHDGQGAAGGPPPCPRHVGRDHRRVDGQSQGGGAAGGEAGRAGPRMRARRPAGSKRHRQFLVPKVESG